MAKISSSTRRFGRAAGLVIANCLLAVLINGYGFQQQSRAAETDALANICRPQSFDIPTTVLTRTAMTLGKRQPLKILAIGSSSTEGIGASAPQFTYPARLKMELSTRIPAAKIDVRNAGIGGETIDQTLKRLDDEIDHFKPDLVLWQVGTNDAVSGISDPEVFHKLVDKGIKSIQRQKIDVILIDSQFYLTIPDVRRYEHYVDLVHTTGDDDGVVVFPRYKLMQVWNGEPGGVTPMLGADHFHMGDRGYACLANLLAGEIVTSLARTSATAGTTKTLQP